MEWIKPFFFSNKLNIFIFFRKAVKKGFDFTLMVVGESGLGKSTLINSMFLTDIYQVDKMPRPGQTLKVDAHKVKLVEHEVNLTLTVVDTPGNTIQKNFLI